MLETHYIAISSALISGFHFPILTAILLLGYGVGRVFYTLEDTLPEIPIKDIKAVLTYFVYLD